MEPTPQHQNPTQRREATARRPGIIGATNVLVLLVCLTAFVAELDLEKRGVLDRGLDLQVMLRSAFWFVLAFYCVVSLKSSPMLFRLLRDIKWWGVLITWLCGTAAFSPTPLKTFVSAFSLLCVITFIWIASQELGNRKIAILIRNTLLVFLAISIITYMIAPTFSRLVTWDGHSNTLSLRMEGIASHPNSIGTMAVLSLLITAVYDKWRISIIYISKLAIPVSALFLSGSRTSAGALLILWAGQYLFRRSLYVSLITTVVLGVAVAFVSFIGFDYIEQAISRTTGGADIETGTGRIFIWQMVWSLVQYRPILGYGYNTTVYYLPQNINLLDPRAQFAVPQAHNMLLQLLFCGGLVAIGIFLLASASTVWRLLKTGADMGLAYFFFAIIIGVMESSIFGGSANTLTLALALALSSSTNNKNVNLNQPRVPRVRFRPSWHLTEVGNRGRLS